MIGKFTLPPTTNITFGNGIGSLDVSGDKLTFTGDADESAKILFDFVAKQFDAYIQQLISDELETMDSIFSEMSNEEFNALYEDNKVRYADSDRFATMFAMSIWKKMYQTRLKERLKEKGKK